MHVHTGVLFETYFRDKIWFQNFSLFLSSHWTTVRDSLLVKIQQFFNLITIITDCLLTVINNLFLNRDNIYTKFIESES